MSCFRQRSFKAQQSNMASDTPAAVELRVSLEALILAVKYAGLQGCALVIACTEVVKKDLKRKTWSFL